MADAAGETPDRRPSPLPIAARIIILALAFRAASAGVGFLGNTTFPDYQNQGFSMLAEPHPFWDRFTRFDSGWYHGIASQGYAYVPGGRSNLAFFPLYPTLMGAGGRLLGGRQEDFYFTGIVISWLSFAVAMALLYQLARLDLTPEAALRGTALAAVFPSAYFFGVVYSESLFVLTLVGATLAIRQRRWGWAAVAGAAMTATRVNGVMFVPALAWLAWQSAEPTPRGRARAAAAVAASLAGIGAYCAYNYALSGNPLEWYDSIQRWGYAPGGNPFSGLLAIGQALATRPMQFLTQERMAPYDAWNAAAATFALLAIPFVWRRFGFAYAAIIGLGLALPLSSGQFEGLGRYCSVLFPLPLLLGTVSGEARWGLLLTVSVMLYTLGMLLFGNAHPVF